MLAQMTGKHARRARHWPGRNAHRGAADPLAVGEETEAAVSRW